MGFALAFVPLKEVRVESLAQKRPGGRTEGGGAQKEAGRALSWPLASCAEQ